MKNKTKSAPKISAALAKALSEGDGEYELSSSFSMPTLRRFYGEWEVCEHLVDGQPFLDRFRERNVRGLRADGARYQALYVFKEDICCKRVTVEGALDLPEGGMEYVYRMAVALSWDLLPGDSLRVRPELGYQCSYLDGAPAATGELNTSAESDIILRYRFEDGDLILEEGTDVKRLRKTE